MTAFLRWVVPACAAFRTGSGSFTFTRTLAALLLLLSALAGARAQTTPTTSISGTVYDPRTNNALPLYNVLVYATVNPVAPLASGVQCLTTATPTNVVSYTYTAVDGTFTLNDIPQNGTYTLVIQAGKWRRQFTETVGTTPLTSLQLHMPADHTQGDIPMIAIVTGSVDGVECVLHDMGIANTEFTDDNGSVNPGGHIHLYKGKGSAGAQINASTPIETALTSSAATLSNYDVVMLPCQGSAYTQTTTPLSNLLNYANSGGRLFATHFSYVYLDPDSPYNAQFPAVVNWKPNQSSPTPDPGVATVATNFTDGAEMAQWLQNAGADYNNTAGQIQISTLRHDFNGVIPPTQSWLTLNNTTAGNPVMQFTFNTPVGAPAANQCGRVLFNEYHVMNLSTAGKTYPAECTGSGTMSAQEAMLEYALFDLSAFVQPVIVPALTLSFTPNPVSVKQSDSGDQIILDAVNTSSTTPIDSSTVLTFTVPSLITVTGMTDSSGGWNCTVATLTCTRSTLLSPGTTDSVTLTFSVGAYPPGGLTSYTAQITATASNPVFSQNPSATGTLIFQQVPTITWATPAPIIYGTALSATQLDATASVPGSFAYSPAAGTVLAVGQHTLNTAFTPNDTADYTNASASVTLTVLAATPQVTVTASANPVFLKNAVTFTVAVTSAGITPTGTVTFLDGTTSIGTATLSAGTASITTSALAQGTHPITVAYSGDSSYQATTSNVLNENVEDFTLTAVSSSLNVSPRGVATYTLILTPVGGPTMPGGLTLSVTGLPFDAVAAFSPATVAAGSGTSNVSLTITLDGHGTAHAQRPLFGRGSLPVALGLLLLPFARKWRKTAAGWRQLALWVAAAAVLAIGISGCGGNYAAQTYGCTVTAASGELSHTLPLQLTIK